MLEKWVFRVMGLVSLAAGLGWFFYAMLILSLIDPALSDAAWRAEFRTKVKSNGWPHLVACLLMAVLGVILLLASLGPTDGKPSKPKIPFEDGLD